MSQIARIQNVPTPPVANKPVAQAPKAPAAPAPQKPVADSVVLTSPAAQAFTPMKASAPAPQKPTVLENLTAPFRSKAGKNFMLVGLGLGLVISAAFGVSLGVSGVAKWAIGLTLWTGFGGAVAAAVNAVIGVGNALVHAVTGK